MGRESRFARASSALEPVATGEPQSGLRYSVSPCETASPTLRNRLRDLERSVGSSLRVVVEKIARVPTNFVDAQAVLPKDGRGQRLLVLQEAEEKMHGADVVVLQPIGFRGRDLNDMLGGTAELDHHGEANRLASRSALAHVLSKMVR